MREIFAGIAFAQVLSLWSLYFTPKWSEVTNIQRAGIWVGIGLISAVLAVAYKK